MELPMKATNLRLWALSLGLIASCAQAQTVRQGEEVYQRTCVACHGTGAQGAPKLGDKAKWKPLIAEGQAVLTSHGAA